MDARTTATFVAHAGTRSDVIIYINTHTEKLQKMPKATESVQKINEARQAEEEDVTDADPLKEQDDGPQVTGEATAAMNDAFDLHQNDETGPTLDELVSSLNADQSRVFKQVKSHLEHQAMHEHKTCTCHDLKPLHMFVSCVGGTGKSFLIRTICALVSNTWDDLKNTTLCAVTAPTGLAAFNVVESPSTDCCNSP